mgnify:CR=1 FL=1
MCIRDRACAVGAAALATATGASNTTGSPGAAGAGMVISGPVSYTHLRAHETVLDLVCRLLLEKKKDREENIKELLN